MKTAWKLCLALALMVAALFVVSVPAFAAENHTVSGTISNLDVDKESQTLPEVDVPSFDGKEFRLYKVGTFGRNDEGKSYIVSKYDIADLDLDITQGEDETDAAYTIRWLVEAQKIANHIRASAADPDVDTIKPDYTTTISGNAFSFTGTEQNPLDIGVYLLIGDDLVVKGDDGKKVVWSPCPMLIQVLNDDVTGIGIKTIHTPYNVKEFSILKSWDDAGHEALRPDTISIKVYYRDAEDGTDKLYKEVQLKKSENYTYSEKNIDSVKASYFFIDEDLESENYRMVELKQDTFNDEERSQSITFTNKYDRYRLKLLKKMPAFIANGDQATTTFVFEVKGYDEEAEGQGKEVYSTRVGLQVEQGETEKPIEVPDIPRTVKRITVKEIYFGGYTPNPSDAQTATVTVTEDEGREYSVTFTNTFNTPFYSGGVINRFTRIFDENNKPTYEWTKPEGSVFKSED